MRREYHICIIENGKVKKSAYIYRAKKYMLEKYDSIKEWYENKNIELGLYEVVYYGNTFHHATKLAQ